MRLRSFFAFALPVFSVSISTQDTRKSLVDVQSLGPKPPVLPRDSMYPELNGRSDSCWSFCLRDTYSVWPCVLAEAGSARVDCHCLQMLEEIVEWCTGAKLA
ncbi:hypothetical protein F5890DRAFT_535305 [Lentinula detonsa]|uniref:Extracellular membrane protein CFEM domain-containing protein n=1 Tax=Lentinula detonsa TaxID=2804962 RepID=A0AA38UP16_9AGAR|nr:hypothetical protein F5890DRAFT_535305 [Lentinula detonsa]